MKQVCISSTVLNNHISWDYSFIKDIQGLKLNFIEQDIPFWSINKNELDLLAIELGNLIDGFILKRDLTENSDFLIEYKSNHYRLNLKDNFDWYIGFLIDLYNMVIKTSEHNSYLYIFNKDVLKAFDGESIIAYLRTHPWLNEEELFNGVNALWRDLSLDKEIDKETIQKGLAHLILNGLIYYNRKKDEYSVTAIGYIYW